MTHFFKEKINYLHKLTELHNNRQKCANADLTCSHRVNRVYLHKLILGVSVPVSLVLSSDFGVLFNLQVARNTCVRKSDVANMC